MTANVQSAITQMKSATAIAEAKKSERLEETDKNMFLKLMLQQLEYQDPTEPTSNEQWLAQLAQYSTLEEMQNFSSGLSEVSQQLSAMQGTLSANSTITQTLALIGKDVTLEVPNKEDETKMDKVTGKVSEATFEDGAGMIKVNGETYPINYITAIKDASISN